MITLSDPKINASRREIFNYTYDIRFDNWNYQTLQKFSTRAMETMEACPLCPYYPEFQSYVNYYGTPEYADMFVMSASKNETTIFPSARGNADFSKFNSGLEIGHAEGVQKGSLLLNVWMEVVRHLNDAMVICGTKCGDNCNRDGTLSLDAGIALYAGSQAGKDMRTADGGIMLYNMANRRAKNFRTAGSAAERAVGTAYVNHMIEKEFKLAQVSILTDRCDLAEQSKKRIVALMKVPLIQGLLRYAYIRDFELPTVLEEREKAEAEAASFLAAAIPHVYQCNKQDADFIFNQMRVGSDPNDVNFAEIKQALERNYECMGMSCPLVGGKYDTEAGQYAVGAEPCNFGTLDGPDLSGVSSPSRSGSSSSSDKGNAGAAVGYVFASCAGILIAFVGYRRYQRRKNSKKMDSMHGGQPSPNLAAISEIA